MTGHLLKTKLHQLIAGIQHLVDGLAVAVEPVGLAIAATLINIVMKDVPDVADPTLRLPYFQDTVFPQLRTTIAPFQKQP